MSGLPQAPSVPPFQIDHEALGVFLAEAFIKRVSVFELAEQVLLLRACRKRLAQQAGEFERHLLTASHTPKPLSKPLPAA